MPKRHLDNTPSYNSYRKQLQKKWRTKDIGEDTYDYRSLLKYSPDIAMAVLADAQGAHFPDTYKLPTHPTYSDESMYSKPPFVQGGHWVQNPIWQGQQWNYRLSPSQVANNWDILRTLEYANDAENAGFYVTDDKGRYPIINGIVEGGVLPNIDVVAKPLRPRRSLKTGGIYIKPENRGKFTETMKRTGKTAEELSHSSNPLTRKRAIFALNARKWNH